MFYSLFTPLTAVCVIMCGHLMIMLSCESFRNLNLTSPFSHFPNVYDVFVTASQAFKYSCLNEHIFSWTQQLHFSVIIIRSLSFLSKLFSLLPISLFFLCHIFCCSLVYTTLNSMPNCFLCFHLCDLLPAIHLGFG